MSKRIYKIFIVTVRVITVIQFAYLVLEKVQSRSYSPDESFWHYKEILALLKP